MLFALRVLFSFMGRLLMETTLDRMIMVRVVGSILSPLVYSNVHIRSIFYEPLLSTRHKGGGLFLEEKINF